MELFVKFTFLREIKAVVRVKSCKINMNSSSDDLVLYEFDDFFL